MNKKTLKLLNSKFVKSIVSGPLIINDHMPDEFYQKILVDEVVNTLDKDDLKSIVYYIHNDSIKLELLTRESIYNKIEYYRFDDIVFNEQAYYFKLISFLESKDNYLCISAFLRDIKDEDLVTELLLSIKFHRILFDRVRELSDYNKIKFFDVVDVRYRPFLISLINSDAIKIKYLNNFSFFEKLSIICGLNNDIYKVEYLKNSEYKEYKEQILKSIKNKSILLNLFNLIEEKEDKIKYIITITNPNVKYILYKDMVDLSLSEKILIAHNILSYSNDKDSKMVMELQEIINSNSVENVMYNNNKKIIKSIKK